MKMNDLTGKKSGKLTVLEPTSNRQGRYIIWKCQCDCGKVCEVPSNRLRKGETKSCGCLKKSELSCLRSGRLTAIEPTDKKDINGNIIWKCQCDCGNICEVSSASFRNNSVRSCGCLFPESQTASRIKRNSEVCVEGTNIELLSSKPTKANKSGRRGVIWNKRTKSWFAYISFQNKTVSLGYFKKFEDAVKAREQGEEKYFKPILEKNGRTLK